MSNETVNNRDTLWNLVKDIKFAMFTTTHRDNGHLHSRPMTTQNSEVDHDSALWFFASRKGEPVSDIAAVPSVNISYSDPGKDSYVSVSGTAMVVNDMAKIKQLWSKEAAAWFPGGTDDPDLALVQVKITHADYWDVKESKMTQLYKIAAAAVSGKPPSMGEHGHVQMS